MKTEITVTAIIDTNVMIEKVNGGKPMGTEKVIVQLAGANNEEKDERK